MKRFSLFVCTIVLLVTSLQAQKATISFQAAKDCQAIIYEPIDGAYNHRLVSRELALVSGKKENHCVEIDTFGIVFMRFPQCQKKCEICLFPGDSVLVEVDDQQLRISGNNQDGNQFYYDHFTLTSLGENYKKMTEIFEEYYNRQRGIQSIAPEIYQKQIQLYIQGLEKLVACKKTSEALANVWKTQISLTFNSYLIDMLETALSKCKDNDFVAVDSLIITQQLDSIFHLYPVNKRLLKYKSTIFIGAYLRKLSNIKSYDGWVDEKIFGPYKKNLHAPKDVQPYLFGNACMVQLMYNTGEMNLQAVQAFLNKEFPKHPYIVLVNKKISEALNLSESKQSEKHVTFIDKIILSFDMLADVPELKGKYIFVDLWASWCMPCRAEFNYQKQLHQVLHDFKDIAIVYVTIDKQQQCSAWKNCIEHYKLDGFHLMATEDLRLDIQQKIYKDASIQIPRYILISPQGNVLHNDLPRPSQYPQLREILSQIIQ